MQRITELQKDLDKKDSTMKNWNSVQEELRQKQLKTHDKVEELQVAHRESTEKKKELEQMVISYEEIVSALKLKTELHEAKIKELNEKLLKKCIDFEDIQNKYH